MDRDHHGGIGDEVERDRLDGPLGLRAELVLIASSGDGLQHRPDDRLYGSLLLLDANSHSHAPIVARATPRLRAPVIRSACHRSRMSDVALAVFYALIGAALTLGIQIALRRRDERVKLRAAGRLVGEELALNRSNLAKACDIYPHGSVFEGNESVWGDDGRLVLRDTAWLEHRLTFAVLDDDKWNAVQDAYDRASRINQGGPLRESDLNAAHDATVNALAIIERSTGRAPNLAPR
jgi:hypothetical protein